MRDYELNQNQAAELCRHDAPAKQSTITPAARSKTTLVQKIGGTIALIVFFLWLFQHAIPAFVQGLRVMAIQ